MRIIYCLLLTVVFICSCQQKDSGPGEKPVTKAKASTIPLHSYSFLNEPITPSIVESAAEALPIWRTFAVNQLTLVLLTSDIPFFPYPAKLRAEVENLAKNATQAELRRSALPSLANPILMPNMALSAAIDSGFFSEVIWLVPTKPDTVLTIEQFRKKLIANGSVDEKDASSFQEDDGNFVGTIRNTKFVVTTSNIPNEVGPFFLHLDLSYFRPGYHNEIRKRLNLHVRDTLKSLRESRLEIVGCTISSSNISGDLPLQTRFLGGLVRDFIANPRLLDEPATNKEQLRSDAMYLASFFRKEDVLHKYSQLEEIERFDAAVKYDLYQTLRQFNRIADAQKKLDEAVSLDPVYGLEFLTLAEIAMEKKRPDGALRMYEKAEKIFPDNPFIRLSIAKIQLQYGDKNIAKNLLTALSGEEWSPIYNFSVKHEIEELLSSVN